MIDVQTHTLARKREEERMRQRLDENFWCCFGLVFLGGETGAKKSKEREEDGGVILLYKITYLL